MGVNDEARITVDCPVCHRVELTPDRITVFMYATGATYAFLCGCGTRTVVNASVKIVRMLTDVGVKAVEIVLPDREPRDAPPIDPEEILDLWEALNLHGDDWLDELSG